MRFTLSFDMDNAAFHDGANTETTRLLREVADDIELDGADCGELRDINGNNVGLWAILD